MIRNEFHKLEALQFLKNLKNKSVDLILTDPPYKLDMTGGSKSNKLNNRRFNTNDKIRHLSNGFDSI